tara:strand:+ start:34785 stop:35159 length:375 start_codon:yes stop_codon:yes gene_type:complete
MQNDKYLTLYDPATGVIAMQLNGPLVKKVANSLWTTIPDDGSYRVNLDTLLVVKKSTFDYASHPKTSGNLLLTNVPINTELHWQSESFTIIDGVIDIDLDQLGLFTLLLCHPLYLDRVITIENS